MREIWKEIKGYEGYEVSNLGNVRSYLKRNSKQRYDIPRELTKGITPTHCKEYVSVILSQEGKRKKFYVHRLVATTFIENTHTKPQVHHIDNDEKNNRFDNLQWVTNSENQLEREDWKRISGYKYVFKNRGAWRAANSRLGFDRCFKTRKVAVAFSMQYY
jgi:hypothetical protein